MGVISIVVADDHPVVRLGLRTLLESEPNFKVVGEASDGLEAVQKVKRLLPDVVILDSTMPYLNGVEAARQVRAQFPHIRIIILTTIENDAYTADVVSSIADANVPKQSPAEDLVIAIHEILARKRHLNSSLNERATDSYLQYARSIKAAESGPLITLTPREREVLILVAQGRTSGEIGQRLAISARTVETHRANMMHKLGLNSSAQLTCFATEHGLIDFA